MSKIKNIRRLLRKGFKAADIYTGADLGFSRGGGLIFKKCSKIFVDLFFRSTEMVF